MQNQIVSQIPLENSKTVFLTIVTDHNYQEIANLYGINFPKDPNLLKESKKIVLQTEEQCFIFQGYERWKDIELEKYRVLVHQAVQKTNQLKWADLVIVFLGIEAHPDSLLLARAMGEIPYLSNYQYLTLKTQKEPNTLQNLTCVGITNELSVEVEKGIHIAKATCLARDLVNMPPNMLNAVTLAQHCVDYGKTYGFRVEVFEKSRIESLKMGGLLAVNRGSKTPPTFSILEWKPEHVRNDKPIVLVGKGITFDTGGLSLKPNDAMNTMKCDMAGAAAVIGLFCAAAANQLPYHLIGLIPSTDNRPGEDAYTPNDVITMHDGTTVEVLNTDAEGRLILADALAFANQYEPELAIDLATLTGAAVIAVGEIGIPLMSTANSHVTQEMIQAGYLVYERVVQFPLWDEYKEQLKSDIADLKNVGTRYGGAITAAKFLQHFVHFPWMHLDIAGPAFISTQDNYRPKNATGVGVRLLYYFLENYERWGKQEN